ncbi:MAG: methionyl-tRNA formyltransferase [Ruminococcaceae bacterium]|nr:methionyl-tRNA formyltransferase [Oscillospiraceae bacterium]
MKILFMGTPEFARDQLTALWENREANGWDIVGVISQPDKPKGRGYKLIPTPVKEYAETLGLPVYQPTTLRDEAFAALLAALDPELIVVAAYGKILPRTVLDYPKYGCINVHGSHLPAYRGAAPIQRAIMDGLTVTGNTIQFMADGIDTGDMIAKDAVVIGENEDFGSLYDRMGKSGGKLLVSVIPMIENGTVVPQVQDDAAATYAPKIEKAECALDFSASAQTLHNKIRALSPAPLGISVLQTEKETKNLKIVSTVVVENEGVHGTVGEVLSVDAKKGVIAVACGEGVLGITALVPEGKGRMNAGDFIRGRKIDAGDRLLSPAFEEKK